MRVVAFAILLLASVAEARVTTRFPESSAARTSSAGDNNGFESHNTGSTFTGATGSTGGDQTAADVALNDGEWAIDLNTGNGTIASCGASTNDQHEFYEWQYSVAGHAADHVADVRLQPGLAGAAAAALVGEGPARNA